MTNERRSNKRKHSAKSRATRAAAKPIVVATSGGADSGAALLLARAAMPDARLYAVYIDHGLRPRASIAADVAAVRAQARHAGARVLVRKVNVPRRGVSIEAQARKRRYAALARTAQSLRADTVISGHHRDDIAETALLALVRGSGLDGLSAMRERLPLAPGVVLRRPLLAYSKAQLVELLRAAGVPFATDETNDDLRLRRNAIRACLRELERFVPGSSRAIARSAMLLAGDKAVLNSLTHVALERALVNSKRTDLSAKALRALPDPLLRRVLRLAVRRNLRTLEDFDASRCRAIARAIIEGRGGSFPAARGTHVEVSAGKVAFRAGPRMSRPANAAPSSIVVPAGTAVVRDTQGRISMRRVTAARRETGKHHDQARTFIDSSALPAGTKLTVRMPRAGDKCIPSGRHRPVSLRKFLAKSGVPNSQRDAVLLLCRGPHIIAALGVRVMEPHAPRDGAVLDVRHTERRSG